MTTYESGSGSIVHVELNTGDPAGTRALLEDAFGWTFEVMEEMNYMTFQAPNPPGGGIVLEQEEGPFSPPPTLLYVAVDDLEATNAAIVEAGGEVLVEGMEVPDMGVFTIFADPGGVVQAAWEDTYGGESPEGGWPPLTDEPAAGSITHFELYSGDPKATRAFYEAVFGWTFEGIADDGYTMARPPTPPYGGVMQASDEMPVGTLLYLLVEDAEAAMAAVGEAGGHVLREPFEVEGWGTMAVFEAPGDLVLAAWESAPTEGSGDEAAEPEAAD